MDKDTTTFTTEQLAGDRCRKLRFHIGHTLLKDKAFSQADFARMLGLRGGYDAAARNVHFYEKGTLASNSVRKSISDRVDRLEEVVALRSKHDDTFMLPHSEDAENAVLEHMAWPFFRVQIGPNWSQHLQNCAMKTELPVFDTGDPKLRGSFMFGVPFEYAYSVAVPQPADSCHYEYLARYILMTYANSIGMDAFKKKVMWQPLSS